MAYGLQSIDLLFRGEDRDYVPPPPPDPDPDPDPNPPPSYQSIFTDQIPVQTGQTDNTYSLGTLFKSDVDGKIAGVRVYVGAIPTTIPFGALYTHDSDAAGTFLASKVFGTLTPFSWNTVLFDTPVDIVAETFYMTVWGPTDNYNATGSFFVSTDVVNGHLSSLRGITGRENGKFKPTPGDTSIRYPDLQFNAGCYFVDVLFLPDE